MRAEPRGDAGATDGGGVKPKQVEYQQAAYDSHYPKMATAVVDQLAHPLLRSFYDRLAERILDSVESRPQPLRLFEAGCGEGLLASAVQRVAARREQPFSYTGTDLSAAGLALAGTVVTGDLRHGEAVEVVSGLAAGSQDLLWAKNLLHHLEDPAEFLRQAVRAVSPSGRVVIVEPRMWCPVNWVNLLYFRKERYQFQGYRRTLNAFAEARCRVVQTQEFGWLPYELALATRFGAPRRALSFGARGIDRVTAVDDRLTAVLPNLALYMVTVVVADDR